MLIDEWAETKRGTAARLLGILELRQTAKPSPLPSEGEYCREPGN